MLQVHQYGACVLYMQYMLNGSESAGSANPRFRIRATWAQIRRRRFTEPALSDVGFYLAVFGRTGSGMPLTCGFGLPSPGSKSAGRFLRSGCRPNRLGHPIDLCIWAPIARIRKHKFNEPLLSDVGSYLAVFGRTGSGIPLTCAFEFGLPSAGSDRICCTWYG